MPHLLTQQYRTFLTRQFLDSVSNGHVSAYLFIGNPQEWADPDDNTINDTNPPTPRNTVQQTVFEFWRSIIGFKRVGTSNAAMVVARTNWTANTVYEHYDNLLEDQLADTDYYVLDNSTLPLRVYKCLWNNNGQPSTIAPSTIGNAVNPITTLDNYVWQYLYTITSENYRFLTSDWMPVLSDDLVVTNAKTFAGRLPTAVPLIVTTGGSNYNTAIATTTTITGDGSGATVTANGVTIVGGAVQSVTLATGGIAYSQVTNVSIAQVGVTNTAVVRIIIPPFPNHGADPVHELGAKSLMVIGSFRDNENNKLTIKNDFRMNGLIVNPLDVSGNMATELFYSATYDIGFSSNTGVLQPDDIVVNTSKANAVSALVVDVIPSTNAYIVRLTNVNPGGFDTPFELNDVVKCKNTGVEVITANVTTPVLQQFTGDILFVNYRTPVLRSDTQVEDFKFIFPLG